jgi:acyl-CoA synthetase (NDP forming)
MTPRPSPEALLRLLRPKTIAVVGGREAEIVAKQCDRLGYGGEIWPVNGRRESIAGRDCFQRLEDLPAAPDAAFVAIPAEPTIEAVEVLADMGAGGAVCFASGFREVGRDGARRQERLITVAAAMPMMGPNCHGFVDYIDGAALWPDQHGGARVERGVALITQSGNMAINLSMQQRALPLAYLVTLGNQAMIGIPECIEALAADERITAIGLHIEGLGDLAAFEHAAAAARARNIPLVALKTGRSVTGAEIALSHTASLAGPDGLYDALFERLGVARVHTIPELLETLKLLSVCGPLPGTRICSMSCSGGEASLIADLAEGRDVHFPPMAADHRKRVAATLNDLVSVSNPLDYHTFIWGEEAQLAATFTAMMGGGYDLSMVILDFPRRDRCDDGEWWATADAVAAAAQVSGGRAAVLAGMPECLPEDVGAYLAKRGIAPMQGMAEALTAIEAASQIGRVLADGDPPALLHPAPPAHDGSRVYDEWESKRMLAAHGLSIPDGALAASPTEAVAAAEALGYPVAVKAVAAEMAHKTEHGAIALNLIDADAVDAAATRMFRISGRVLVEKMMADGVAELIVGIDRDAQFGPYLVVGFGGVLVELIDDSHTLLLPTAREHVLAALQSLKTAPMLTGYRGLPSADLDAALDAVMAVAAFAAAHADTILELDVNPLIVRPQGKGAVAADALVRLAEPE